MTGFYVKCNAGLKCVNLLIGSKNTWTATSWCCCYWRSHRPFWSHFPRSNQQAQTTINVSFQWMYNEKQRCKAAGNTNEYIYSFSSCVKGNIFINIFRFQYIITLFDKCMSRLDALDFLYVYLYCLLWPHTGNKFTPSKHLIFQSQQ